jgi:hypothetical protein
MKLTTLQQAKELEHEINQLKGQLAVIDHITRADYKINPPSYNIIDSKTASASHYYVPKEIWLAFLSDERKRITKELKKIQQEFDRL